MNNSHFQIEYNIFVLIKMYCDSNRLYYSLTFLYIALGYACLVCFISTCNMNYKARATISTSGVYIKRLRLLNAPWKYVNHQHLFFNLRTDLTHLFGWNVEHLVISLTAVYETTDSLEQIILWNRIILRREDANLDLQAEPSEYSLMGHGKEGLIRGPKNVTLYLSCNIIPSVGNVPTIIAQDSHSFEFPDIYARIDNV
ncbi:hypothetical protein WA026_009682 [Henosepilachna vigintioctopunctata]|uniref:Signal peptidase complex subunit 3 n=1 Tax=Henosepilachna vigintioctopunctata TaxID=420089 RepID=A0AAW1U4M1_9CUCU